MIDTTLTPLLLRPCEAARALAISARKLWSLTACGELRVVRIGRSVRYCLVDIEAFIAQRTKDGAR